MIPTWYSTDTTSDETFASLILIDPSIYLLEGVDTFTYTSQALEVNSIQPVHASVTIMDYSVPAIASDYAIQFRILSSIDGTSWDTEDATLGESTSVTARYIKYEVAITAHTLLSTGVFDWISITVETDRDYKSYVYDFNLNGWSSRTVDGTISDIPPFSVSLSGTGDESFLLLASSDGRTQKAFDMGASPVAWSYRTACSVPVTANKMRATQLMGRVKGTVSFSVTVDRGRATETLLPSFTVTNSDFREFIPVMSSKTIDLLIEGEAGSICYPITLNLAQRGYK